MNKTTARGSRSHDRLQEELFKQYLSHATYASDIETDQAEYKITDAHSVHAVLSTLHNILYIHAMPFSAQL